MKRSVLLDRGRWTLRASLLLAAATILCGVLVPLTASAGVRTQSATKKKAACGVGAELVPTCGIWWGGHASIGWQAFETLIGRKIAIEHDYAAWSNNFPSPNEKLAAAGGRIIFVAWQTGPSYAQIASGAEDARINAEAASIKAFGKTIMLTFEHEPDSAPAAGYGSAGQYVAAWRHIHDRFASDGVKNVVWVWNVTGDTQHPLQNYYPGDAYVNWIMWDPYNWYTCRAHAEPWQTFAQKASLMYGWLTSHSGTAGNGDYLSKPWGIAETGTVEGPSSSDKSKWYEAAVTQTQSQLPRIKAVVFFDSDNVASGRSCNWEVNTSATSLQGFKSAGHMSYVASMP